MPATANADALIRAVQDDLGPRLAAKLNEAFIQQARDNASRRTGAMADSVEVVEGPDLQGDTIVSRIEVGADYGIYQDQGTGIFGPEGAPITPRSSRVLVFDWPAAGGIVFARSVRGSEPTRWWQRTLDAWATIVRRVSG
jgi:hypothetical protein